MAGIPTLDPRSSMEALHEDHLYTAVRLLASADSDIQALAAPFQAWEDAWWAAYKKERGLIRAVYMASAVIDRIDVDLDAISDTVAVHARLEDKARKVAALIPMLFGSQIPSVFKKPIMGMQFDSMKSWPPILSGSSNASLHGQSGPLASLLAEGDKAVDQARTAETQIQEFRLTGDRRALVDSLNALRKVTHGKLGEIAHQKKRGSGYAESFFRRESGSRELSLDEVERRIAAARGEVERLEGKRAELLAVAEADAKTRAEAERKLKAAQLAEAQKLAAEAQARVDALQAELAGAPIS